MLLLSFISISLFAFLIKYIDDTKDEDAFGGKFLSISLVGGIISSILASYFSNVSFLFLFSITIGCFLSKKLDIKEFKIIGIVILLFAILNYHYVLNNIGIIIFWSTISYMDEIINNFSENNIHHILKIILKNKPLMPLVGLLFFVLYNDYMIFFIICFDFSYSLVPLMKHPILKFDPKPQMSHIS